MSAPKKIFVGESRLYAIDFRANLSQLVDGELITSVTSIEPTPASGCALSSKAVASGLSAVEDGKGVSFRATPTVAGSYEIQAKVVTDGGNTLEASVTLIVKEL